MKTSGKESRVRTARPFHCRNNICQSSPDIVGSMHLFMDAAEFRRIQESLRQAARFPEIHSVHLSDPAQRREGVEVVAGVVQRSRAVLLARTRPVRFNLLQQLRPEPRPCLFLARSRFSFPVVTGAQPRRIFAKPLPGRGRMPRVPLAGSLQQGNARGAGSDSSASPGSRTTPRYPRPPCVHNARRPGSKRPRPAPAPHCSSCRCPDDSHRTGRYYVRRPSSSSCRVRRIGPVAAA